MLFFFFLFLDFVFPTPRGQHVTLAEQHCCLYFICFKIRLAMKSARENLTEREDCCHHKILWLWLIMADIILYIVTHKIYH